jgi:hypothetical protein
MIAQLHEQAMQLLLGCVVSSWGLVSLLNNTSSGHGFVAPGGQEIPSSSKSLYDSGLSNVE